MNIYVQRYIVLFIFKYLAINNDKSINLHTRSHKYGKLDNGKFQ